MILNDNGEVGFWLMVLRLRGLARFQPSSASILLGPPFSSLSPLSGAPYLPYSTFMVPLSLSLPLFFASFASERQQIVLLVVMSSMKHYTPAASPEPKGKRYNRVFPVAVTVEETRANAAYFLAALYAVFARLGWRNLSGVLSRCVALNSIDDEAAPANLLARRINFRRFVLAVQRLFKDSYP